MGVDRAALSCTRVQSSVNRNGKLRLTSARRASLLRPQSLLCTERIDRRRIEVCDRGRLHVEAHLLRHARSRVPQGQRGVLLCEGAQSRRCRHGSELRQRLLRRLLSSGRVVPRSCRRSRVEKALTIYISEYLGMNAVNDLPVRPCGDLIKAELTKRGVRFHDIAQHATSHMEYE